MRCSIVMIVSAAGREPGDKLGAALGWGTDNFSLALKVDAAMPVSHFGLCATAGPDLLGMLTEAQESGLHALPGLTQEDMAAALADSIWDMQPDAARSGHFENVIALHGLQRIEMDVAPDYI